MDIIGMAEAADILGVSKTRVKELWKGGPRTSADPKFPAPLGVPRMGPCWQRSTMERYAARRGR